MSEFEKWFADQEFYTNMRFIHGDALFTKDGDVYRVLPVLIAFESWFASACTSIDHIHRLQHEKAKQQSEIDQLKAEKAGLEERIESGLSLAEKWAAIEFEKTTHWSEGYEDGCLHCSLQLDKALRGEHE